MFVQNNVLKYSKIFTNVRVTDIVRVPPFILFLCNKSKGLWYAYTYTLQCHCILFLYEIRFSISYQSSYWLACLNIFFYKDKHLLCVAVTIAKREDVNISRLDQTTEEKNVYSNDELTQLRKCNKRT